MTTSRVALLPADAPWLRQTGSGDWLADAVRAGGGQIVPPDEAEGLVWADPAAADELAEVIARHPHLRWVQLPFAGVESVRHLLDHDRVWTCAKGIYGPTTAEHALALTLAGLRDLRTYLREDSWTEDRGRNLYGASVTILGGGGIARALVDLLEPFGCAVTIVRRSFDPLPGADRTVTADALDDALGTADVVVLALPLTDETTGIIDTRALTAMQSHAWLVNVARGGHVVTADLVAALRAGTIGGAALDVTDPEPLPKGHPLWELDNCIITPHVANTHEMLQPRLVELVTENVRRFAAGEPLLGVVDPDRGY